MLRPLIHYEAPWSRATLRPLRRGGHRWIQRAPAARSLLPPVARHMTGQSTPAITSHSRRPVQTSEPASSHLAAAKATRDGSTTPQDPPESVASQRSQLLEALRSNDPERLLSVAVEAFRSNELVESLPPTTIAQIFDALRFNILLADHWKIAQVLAPGAIRAAQSVGWEVYGIREVIARIQDQFSTLFNDWVDNGRPVDLSKCKSYLRFLAAAGQGREARNLRHLCGIYGIQWDTEAYNLFLEALCWEEAHHPDEFGKLRVTQPTLADRKKQEATSSLIGYSTAIKAEAIEIFEEMISLGYAADVRTFSLLMLSMARVGDLDGVEATLNRIWGIDVSRLSNGDSSNIYFENDMQPDAPLFPDEHLLFLVAHIFGSNNSLSKALKVVDFISQKYSLKIDPRTWEELARWAYILGRRRGGSETLSERKASLQRGLAAGKVPQASYRSLWKTMTSGRFRQTPSLHMFNLMYATHYRRGELLDMVQLLRQARQSFGLGESHAKFTPENAASSRSPLHQYSTELERLKALALSAVFLRWVRLILHTNFFESRGRKLSLRWFHTRFVPNFIAEWGNLWFRNTVLALHCRTMNTSRLSFHRQMQEENRAAVEIFSSSQQGRYIVRPKIPSLGLPFQEITQGERRENRIERDIAYGRFVQYKAPLQWYEQSTIGDWIWLAPGKGIRVEGGRFEGSRFEDQNNERTFTISEQGLDRLETEQAREIRQRLASQ